MLGRQRAAQGRDRRSSPLSAGRSARAAGASEPTAGGERERERETTTATTPAADARRPPPAASATVRARARDRPLPPAPASGSMTLTHAYDSRRGFPRPTPSRHGVASRGRLAHAVRLLRARPRQEPHTNNDPLHIAAQDGRDAIVRALLDAGADKDLAKNDGCTPLIGAAAFGHSAVARMLLDAGADNTKAIPRQDGARLGDDGTPHEIPAAIDLQTPNLPSRRTRAHPVKITLAYVRGAIRGVVIVGAPLLSDRRGRRSPTCRGCS